MRDDARLGLGAKPPYHMTSSCPDVRFLSTEVPSANSTLTRPVRRVKSCDAVMTVQEGVNFETATPPPPG